MEYESGDQQAMKHKYDCLLFDLDDTLYPLSSGIAPNCSKNIQEYMIEKLGIEESVVPDMCYILYKYYGTTMAGLRAIGHDFDYDEFHRLVHGRLPYDLLKPDPVLRNLLLSLPIRKMIFTNSDKHHTAEVLQRLGLEDCFERIVCFETLNGTGKGDVSPSKDAIFDIMGYHASSGVALPDTPIVCKPFELAFRKTFEITGIDPQKTLFFDDSIRNLITAKELGLHTVLVGKSEKQNGADYALESIHNIREAFPELLDAEEREENVRYAQKIAVEA